MAINPNLEEQNASDYASFRQSYTKVPSAVPIVSTVTPKSKAAVAVPDGQPRFWQRMFMDGVRKTVNVSKDVGKYVAGNAKAGAKTMATTAREDVGVVKSGYEQLTGNKKGAAQKAKNYTKAITPPANTPKPADWNKMTSGQKLKYLATANPTQRSYLSMIGGEAGGVEDVTKGVTNATKLSAIRGTTEKLEAANPPKGLPAGEVTKGISTGAKTVKQLGTGTGEAKADVTELNKLKAGTVKESTETTTPKTTLIKKPNVAQSEATEVTKPTISNAAGKLKTPGIGESGAIAPGQAGADIREMISKHNQSTAFSKDIQKSANITEGQKDIVKEDAAKIVKNRTQLTSAEKTELQNYRDAKAAGLTPKPLSSAKLVKEDADVTELNKAAQAADAQRARLAGKEAEAQAIESRDPSTYTHRVAQDKGSTYDYVAQGDRESAFSRSLAKSKPGDKARVMYNLTDEEGGRHTVSIKNQAIKDEAGRTVKRINKQVVEMKNGGDSNHIIGSYDPKTDEANMQKELNPVEKKIDNLTKEKRILTASKSRTEAASKRLANIDNQLESAENDRATILSKYDTNNLDNKTWKAPDGHTYTFGQATQSEITRNSGQAYYTDPKLNAVANYVDSKMALENAKLIEQIKTSPDVDEFVSKPGETAPPGFKSVPSLPQFQDFKFEAKTADVLKDIIGSKDSEPNIFNRVGRFLRQTIVYFPVKHNLNMLTSYMVDRGITKLASPLAYKRMISSLYQATDDVIHQTDFYQAVQKKGFSLVSADGDELDKAFQSEIKNLLNNQDVLSKVAKQVGSTPSRLVAAYKSIQHVAVWEAQDILNIARIRERMSPTVFSKGEDLDTAIDNTAKYNLQYRVPSRVVGSRQLARGLKSDAVFFGTYRYDLYRTFTNILKSSVNVTDPKGAIQAWDKLAATAIGLTLVMPYINKGIQKVTGDPNAHMSAPGGLSVPSDIASLASGKETPGAFLNQNVYLSSGYILPYQLSQNTNAYGEPIYNPYAGKGTQLGEVVDWLKGQIAPLQKMTAVSRTTGNKVATWVMSLSGASLPKDSPDLNKYYTLAYDQASPMYDMFRSQVQAGNTTAAIQTADQYNNQLTTSLQKAWEDNNPGQTITTKEVSQYIQGLYNSPWIKTDSRSIASAKKPSVSILKKVSQSLNK